MTLNAIIIEDEINSREVLKSLLEEYCEQVKVIDTASNVEDAVKILNKTLVDVVFMDIEIQQGTGFDVLSKIENINFEIIFTTAFDHYAIKAFKYSSLDYLLKPIDIDELIQAIHKLRNKKNKLDYQNQLHLLLNNLQQPKVSRICLATGDEFEFIHVSDIILCKAEGSYTNFILTNQKNILVSKHLKEYENLLIEHHFMRVHKSYLINLKEVKRYIKSDGGYIVMNNDDRVSISRNKKEEFLVAMQMIS